MMSGYRKSHQAISDTEMDSLMRVLTQPSQLIKRKNKENQEDEQKGGEPGDNGGHETACYG